MSYSDTDGNGSIDAPTEILSENNYYPFGLKHEGYNSTPSSSNIALKYKYNSKELNDELGLDWYDYGARNYEASLGRWMNIDLLSDKYFSISPYVYTLNKPTIFIDPDGNEVINPYDKKTQKRLYKAANKLIFYASKATPSLYERLHNDTDIKVYVRIGDIKGHHGKASTRRTVSRRITGVDKKTNKEGELIGGEIKIQEYDNKGNRLDDRKISNSEAEEMNLVKVEEVNITINKSDSFSKQVETLGHEFGHANFDINNKFEAFIWSVIGDPQLEGHDKNNPSGKAADKAEQIIKNLTIDDWKKIAEAFKKKKEEEDE